MISNERYVMLSLEQHLFFARIMKEHALFMEAAFTPANADMAREASRFKGTFEDILAAAVRLGNGNVSPAAVESREFVTDFTLGAEQKTQRFTGIPINTAITASESNLYGRPNPPISPQLVGQVRQLNGSALRAVQGLIDFKVRTLDNVRSCRIFTLNYPLLIEHILREARLYQSNLRDLENGNDPMERSGQEQELFWDRQMMEHALFIRGLLDPTENQLINTSNDFAREYAEVMQELRTAATASLNQLTHENINLTTQFRNFKATATRGIAECRIQSIILPLLADHVLREANHFLRLLNDIHEKIHAELGPDEN